MKRIIQQKLQHLRKLCQPKISKPLHESGGLVKDRFNSSVLFLIGLFNLVDIIIESRNLLLEGYLFIPFFIVSILIAVPFTSIITKYMMFIIFGIAYQLSVPDPSYIGSSIFFSLSFIQIPKKQNGIFISLVTVVLIVVKYYKVTESPTELIVVILGFTYLYGNVYNEIQRYKDSIKKLNDYYIDQIIKLKEDLNKAISGEIEPRRNIDAINITQEEKAILHLYCEGYDYNRIQKTLGLNIAPNSVRRKITAIKKENKNKILNGKSKDTNINDAQFGKWLYQKV